ncbi:MAG: ATPase, partial [Candidatus Zixiibacteriota bacterium]
MNPVYLDLHIHTSEDPNGLNNSYDLDTLIQKVRESAQGNDFLISLTDHNTINKTIYLDALKKIKNNLILGVELHIQTHRDEDTKAYHCHIYFDFDDKEVSSEIIDDINSKLNDLYPNKTPLLKDKKLPLLQHILEKFDEYDFILLPHGGQAHNTFDDAIPDGKEFDNAMQRSIYYNFFDGFTSRSNEKTEKTREYLKRLGIQEFVNLITGTDNYNPSKYPKSKNDVTYDFVPTWMFATQTFSGLRLSLTDSSRLAYGLSKPYIWPDSIKSIKLKNDKIDIDVKLTPGLNVIIGESSSGKTLLVDSLHRKITDLGFCDENCKYNEFNVKALQVDYPENLNPHFIRQNFIASVTGDDKKIRDIEIIEKILPENKDGKRRIDIKLNELRSQLDSLFDTVERIESLDNEINRIPVLSELLITKNVNENILKPFSSLRVTLVVGLLVGFPISTITFSSTPTRLCISIV